VKWERARIGERKWGDGWRGFLLHAASGCAESGGTHAPSLFDDSRPITACYAPMIAYRLEGVPSASSWQSSYI
jgi:hypothetical protein